MDLIANDASIERMKICLEIEAQLQQLLAEATPENHESFFSKFYISNEQRKQFVEDTFSLLKSAVAERTIHPNTTIKPIPKLIHRLWLTNPESPAFPPEDYLRRICRQSKRLSGSYSFIFWHNAPKMASALAAQFQEAAMEFREISSLRAAPRMLERINLAIRNQKYVLAGDISKYLILRDIGGIYADLGLDFGADLVDLVSASDVALLLDRNLFFQPAFMAAPPNFTPFRIWCALLSRPEAISAIGLRDHTKFTAGSEIWVHGGVGFTAALILFYDRSYTLLTIPPNRGSLHLESQGSWYKSGNKYGNATLATAPITHLNWELHSRYVRVNVGTNSTSEASGPSKARSDLTRHLDNLYWLN
jgi:hypothetical protein